MLKDDKNEEFVLKFVHIHVEMGYQLRDLYQLEPNRKKKMLALNEIEEISKPDKYSKLLVVKLL